MTQTVSYLRKVASTAGLDISHTYEGEGNYILFQNAFRPLGTERQEVGDVAASCWDDQHRFRKACEIILPLARSMP